MSEQAADKVGIVLSTEAAPGVLHQLTGVIARHHGDIRSVSIIEDLPTDTRIYFELDLPGAVEALIGDLKALGGSKNRDARPIPTKDLRQTDHHHGRRRAGRTSRLGCDFRG